MAENLYGEAAQLSSQTMDQAEAGKREQSSQGAAQTRTAMSETGAMSRQVQDQQAQQQRAQQAQQARMQLEKMKQDSGFIEVTPQMALGLVNVNKNPEYMKMVGQKIRKEQFAGFLNLEWKIKESKMKQPKPFRIIQGNKTVDGYMNWDEQTQSWSAKTIPGSGGPRWDPNRPKGKTGGAGGTGETEQDKEADKFLKHYETQQGKLSAAQKSLSYDPNNAQLKSQVQELQAYVNDNQSRYDQLHRGQATRGGYVAPSGESGGQGGDAIDQIFSEAIGGQQPGPASPGGGPMEIQQEEPPAEDAADEGD